MVGTIRYSAILQFAEYLGFSKILGFCRWSKFGFRSVSADDDDDDVPSTANAANLYRKFPLTQRDKFWSREVEATKSFPINYFLIAICFLILKMI